MFFSLENASSCFPTVLADFCNVFSKFSESSRITLRDIHLFNTQGEINIGLSRHTELEPCIFQGLGSFYYFSTS